MSSVERKMPLWCWTQNVVGTAAHWARQWTSWLRPSRASSGGTYSARMPVGGVGPGRAAVPRAPHAAGADRDRDRLRIARIDADRVDARRRPCRRRPTSARSGWNHSASTIRHVAPRSSDRNRPPGIVPHHSAPSRSSAGASDQISAVAHVALLAPDVLLDLAVGLLGGYAGAAISVHVAPRSSERCSLTPKWPWSSAAYQLPSRGSAIASVTLSPMK